MIKKANVLRVNRMVEDAIAAGARPIVRGGPVADGPLARGAFYRPTLLEVTDSRLSIVRLRPSHEQRTDGTNFVRRARPLSH